MTCFAPLSPFSFHGFQQREPGIFILAKRNAKEAAALLNEEEQMGEREGSQKKATFHALSMQGVSSHHPIKERICNKSSVPSEPRKKKLLPKKLSAS